MDALNTPQQLPSLESAALLDAPWRRATGLDEVPLIDVATLIAGARRAVVVAPHPGDEVLGTGGMLVEFAAFGLDALIIAVSDGEASHDGSRTWTRAALRDKRVTESMQAMNVLGIDPCNVMRWRFADGALGECYDALARKLVAVLRPGDVVFTPWGAGSRADADHDACNRAVAHAVLEHAMSDEAPAWMWNWADSGDPALPLQRAVRVALGPDALARKRRALTLFESQLQRDTDVGASPHLGAALIERFSRPYEALLYAPDL